MVSNVSMSLPAKARAPLERLSPPVQIPQHAFEVAITLYGGGRCNTFNNIEWSERIATTVHQGLCFYLDSLKALSENPQHLIQVHVVPGCIGGKNKQYREIHDGDLQGPKYRARCQSNFDTLPALNDNEDLFPPLVAEAVVTEIEKSILFSYKVSSPQGSS